MHVLTEEELKEVKKLATKSAYERGLELLRIDVRGTRSRPVLEVILDGSRQVAIADCEEVSKVVQGYLDVALGGNTNYRLDVLSPGIDEPLVHAFQYKRSIGRKIEVKTEDGSTTGRLKEVSEGSILLSIEPKKKVKDTPPEEVSIPLAEIRKAKVLVEL